MKSQSDITSKILREAAVVNPTVPANRIASIDVYRGFVMLLMMAEVLSLQKVAEANPDSSFWKFLAFHQSHVEWAGCSLHDIIQPSFTFLVGVVLPYSIGGRVSKGTSFGSLLLHTVRRSLILILMGVFLRSMHSSQTNFTFEDTLTQIGLGYTFLFLISYGSQRIWAISFIIIMIGYWLLFYLYPLPNANFDYASTGVSPDWRYNFEGFEAHWNKNTNAAWAFDRWFLNLFPREKMFLFNSGGYATLSFIPTLGTMILGLFAGNILKSARSPLTKIKHFALIGAGLITIAVVIDLTGINPIVKRIWTPAWTIFSGGICFLLLAFFYGIIDVAKSSNWAFFLLVIGMNSIAAYVIADGFSSFIASSLYIHLGKNFDQLFGLGYASLVKGLVVLTIEWLILYWMYKKKIFIKI